GTAKTQEKEILEVYGMSVIQIPTNRPRKRIDQTDLVFETTDQKYEHVVQEVIRRHEKGQPVLIGTTSILQSEKVASYLKKHNLDFQLLNAKTVEQEVELISQAGQRNRITVATNMAGRGTDIVLGDGVEDLGGLYVLGTEKHESRRVDNQLRGRSGRQGDHGESQFVLSLEDDMLKRFAKEEVEKFLKKMTTNTVGRIENKEILELVNRTQRIVEGSHLAMREYNLKLDDVINDQRSIVYDLRDTILRNEEILLLLVRMLYETIDFAVRDNAPEDKNVSEWDFDKMERTINSLFLTPVTIDRDETKVTKLLDAVDPSVKELKVVIESFADNEQMMAAIPQVMLGFINNMWVKHLEQMSHLKEGIGLRHYQQEDPMRIYQREGLELFGKNYQELRRGIVEELVTFMKNLKMNVEE
ncbi:MAG: accessory Sec system translocase SecA2, partial [Solibacillus sp.]